MTQLEDDVLLNNLLKFPGTIIIYNNDLNSEYIRGIHTYACIDITVRIHRDCDVYLLRNG